MKGKGPKHSSAMPGKNVRVKLRDGTTIVDKFVERKGDRLIFENHEFSKRDIIQFVIVSKSRLNKDKSL